MSQSGRKLSVLNGGGRPAAVITTPLKPPFRPEKADSSNGSTRVEVAKPSASPPSISSKFFMDAVRRRLANQTQTRPVGADRYAAGCENRMYRRQKRCRGEHRFAKSC